MPVVVVVAPVVVAPVVTLAPVVVVVAPVVVAPVVTLPPPPPPPPPPPVRGRMQPFGNGTSLPLMTKNLQRTGRVTLDDAVEAFVAFAAFVV
ncbi:hypothetical protein ACFW1M_37355 [Streptomyces inhibens]|uniref:hypothetical protein n=1 Tax=Streptomyces inhibens TaxID=2293571 RepID=UPI0036C2D740